MLGAGHGGLEAILLGLLVLYGFFQAVAYQGVGLSSLVNTAALLALAAWGAWATEGVIALFALASLGAVFRLRDHSEATAEEVAGRTAAADPAARPSAADPPPTERPERLEDSRYLEE